MSCGVLLSNTYLFRFEFSVASAPTEGVMRAAAVVSLWV
jgi:hypothetical protein